MDKKTLTSLFAESLYQIPDYQRGYAWEERQWKDFIQDIDALVDEQVRSHYTGTIVVYAGRNAPTCSYGIEHLPVVDVVDGQQRLTTVCLYLAVIIRALIEHGETAYESAIAKYLYAGATCRLTLNNDTANTFYDLLKNGHTHTPAQTLHQKRLLAAYTRFHEHIAEQLTIRAANGDGFTYLRELYHAITQKLNFTFYRIEEEAEIGMTFELMNSRGKGLSVLELLKNYMMHWVSRNEPDNVERHMLTTLINKHWKDTYTNLGSANGSEDQCLRIAWTLYCNHRPANWIGYEGFKGDEHIPLRTFHRRSKADTKAFILRFADGLAEISYHYAAIINPTVAHACSPEELRWLRKIRRTGNIANFLPLMVAARMRRWKDTLNEADYIALLQALECYAYRVYLYEMRRSNTGKSSFHRWAYELFTQSQSLPDIIIWLNHLIRYYSPQQAFYDYNAIPKIWYNQRQLVKYTLFEYELHLLEAEGKGKQPHLTWEQLNDASIEHILPQSLPNRSHWKKVWSIKAFNECVHDIGNLVLTQNNANYSNFEFERKKGKPGLSPSYSNSDIRQERRLALFDDWTPREFAQRRAELVAWLNQRWHTTGFPEEPILNVADEEDEDGVEAQPEAVDV